MLVAYNIPPESKVNLKAKNEPIFNYLTFFVFFLVTLYHLCLPVNEKVSSFFFLHYCMHILLSLFINFFQSSLHFDINQYLFSS